MKKLFLLISVLVLSHSVSAKEIRIGSETSNIIHSTIAASSTADGDVIILTDAGPYVNSKVNKDDYTKLSKNITIMADEGVTPIIKFEVPIQGRNGKTAKIIGIKFDCSSLQYDNLIHFNDGENNSLEFENCEFYNSNNYLVKLSTGKKVASLLFKNCRFYNNSSTRGIIIDGTGTIGHLELDGCEISGFVKEFIHGYSGTSHVDECIVNDCYFHNNSRSSIMFAASTVEGTQTCDKLIVKNSTFANINATGEYESIIDIRPYGTANTDAINVLIDHCTFYNNTTINSDHANIRTAYLSDVTVSNCIFAHSEDYARRATYCTGGGNINNCLTFHYTETGTKGHAYGATVNAASIIANPLFTDAANGDFSFPGDWVTMNLSPARGAATDGSDLGDPRWYTAETIPSTDFASPYQFVGTKALLAGNIRLDGSSNIEYYNNQVCGTAKWKIHTTAAVNTKITLNIASSPSGHKLKVSVIDANAETISNLAEGGYSTNSGDIDLGSVRFPAEGDYTIILSNTQEYSSVALSGITFEAQGGGVIDIPGSIPFGEAMLSALAYVDGGELHFTNATNKGYVASQWAKWNIRADAGVYTFTFNVNGTDYGIYKITITDSESNEVYSSANGISNSGSYTTAPVYLDGEYVLQMQNTNSYSAGYLTALSSAAANDVLILDENAENADAITSNNGISKKTLLKRTFAGGMYNTICIPVEPSSSELTTAFGEGYELLQMESATIEGTILNLNFTTPSSFIAGRPYLIKPKKDVKNPAFNAHTIRNYTNNNTKTGTAADFVGTFIATSIPAGANNLFLGAEDKLYFSDAATPIKGMRAYFQVKSGAGVISRARIVANEQVATEVELINNALPDTFGNQAAKRIENGQLLIIRNGGQFNALGVKVK